MRTHRNNLMASTAASRPGGPSAPHVPAKAGTPYSHSAVSDKRQTIRSSRPHGSPRRPGSPKEGNGGDNGGECGDDPAGKIDVKPLLVKPRIACLLLSCGITRLYELLNAGELSSFLDGKSRKITTASIEAYVARRLAPSDSPAKYNETHRRGRHPEATHATAKGMRHEP
jgi:hypothetical protein